MEKQKITDFDNKTIISFLKLIEDISFTKTPGETLEKLMEKTAEILLVEKGCIFLVDEESELEMVMLCAFEGRHKIGHRAKITGNEHPHLKRCLEKDPIFIRPVEKGIVSSVLYVRLELDGDPIGVMVLGASGKKRRFTENDVSIAKAISNLAVKTIQERKRIEKGIRLKTIGKFAANVVHEIRNPAMAAGGFARRAQKQLENECGHAEELKKYLDIIVDEIRRLENSLNNTMNYLKNPELNLSECSLNKIIRQVLTENEEKIPANIQISFNEGKIPPLELDKNLIILFIRQLLRNAKEEILDRQEKICIKTFWKQKNNTVYLEVKNTGSFVRKEKRETIFDPFVTEKSNGKGTGLGLSIVKTIVEKHGGEIDVQSRKNPPQTSFIIKFKSK